MTSCQQFELYAAEADVPRGWEFSNADRLQGWLDGLRDEPFWCRFYPQVLRVEVGYVRGTRSVGAWIPADNAGRIEMAPGHRNELVVLHEIAHVLAAARYGSESHDPWFARVYLELVFFVMGYDTFDALHRAFEAGGIEHDPPRQEIEVGRAREMPA
jgi:putative metallohydrolase (TIGR04338 family)